MQYEVVLYERSTLGLRQRDLYPGWHHLNLAVAFARAILTQEPRGTLAGVTRTKVIDEDGYIVWDSAREVTLPGGRLSVPNAYHLPFMRTSPYTSLASADPWAWQTPS